MTAGTSREAAAPVRSGTDDPSQSGRARTVNVELPFRDRKVAGERLADAVAAWLATVPSTAGRAGLTEVAPAGDVLVLGIPRGGVVVAAEVARALPARLDILVAHKIGAPEDPEFAIGAVTADGTVLVAPWAARETGLAPDSIQVLAEREIRLAREREGRLRAGRPPLSVAGSIAILVDDGLATGSTVHAAVLAARALGAARVVVAAPVASREAVALLEPVADAVVVVLVPARFHAVGQWYASFDQVSDDVVRSLLAADAGP